MNLLRQEMKTGNRIDTLKRKDQRMKILLPLMMVFALTVAVRAQTDKIAGSWMMFRAETGDEVKEPYFVTDFTKDGKMVIMGMEMGTWKFDTKGNRISMASKVDKDFNGESQILKLTDNKLILEKDGVKYYYSRVHPEEIARENKASHLAGNWKVESEENTTTLLKFELPDAFTLVQASNGMSDKFSGTWIYNPKEKSVIFMSFSHLLRGKMQVVEYSANKLVLQGKDRTIQAERLKESAGKIERLTFEEEDFPEEEQQSQYQLPWQDFDEMASVLKEVASLKYTYGKLVNEFNTLKYTNSILSTIKVDTQKPSVEFTNYYISGKDTSQFSQNYKGGLMGRYNDFFPREAPWPYRITGIEKVTVPAGTFECTVVEGINGEQKVKFWMINNLPGVYAKEIIEETDPFDNLEYRVKELEKINYRDGK